MLFGAAFFIMLSTHTLVDTDSTPVDLKYTEYNSSLHCSHPASIDNSLDRGIFSISIVKVFKFLGFPGPLIPPHAGKFGTGKEMAGLGGKKSY